MTYTSSWTCIFALVPCLWMLVMFQSAAGPITQTSLEFMHKLTSSSLTVFVVFCFYSAAVQTHTRRAACSCLTGFNVFFHLACVAEQSTQRESCFSVACPQHKSGNLFVHAPWPDVYIVFSSGTVHACEFIKNPKDVFVYIH